ncbi:MAG: thioredoxin domain-containing protein, partial [Bacteroidota bacterium]
QCPACGRFATQLYPVLAEQLIDTGKARLVFLDFPLTRHEQAFGAAVAARCAGEQDAYWAMHDKLFANQSALFPDDLRGYAAELNLDTEMFNSCFDSSKYDDAIKKDMSLGRLARLRGTPHFVMGYAEEGNRAFLKKPLNDIGLAEFVTVADEMIAEMEAGTR